MGIGVKRPSRGKATALSTRAGKPLIPQGLSASHIAMNGHVMARNASEMIKKKTSSGSRIRANMVMRLSGGLLFACLIASCGTFKSPKQDLTDRPPTSKEVAEWRVKHGFALASEAEIAEAKKREADFVNGRAAAPDGKMKVSFRCGTRVGAGNSNLSTTSMYVLQDVRGRELASGPGYLTKGESATQRAWFSPDGKQAVVFEFVSDCNGPSPLVILFHEDYGNPDLWHTKFLEMSDFLNAPYDEGAHAECRGFLGDELLIKNTTDGTISKKKISELKERHPFPFSVG